MWVAWTLSLESSSTARAIAGDIVAHLLRDELAVEAGLVAVAILPAHSLQSVKERVHTMGGVPQVGAHVAKCQLPDGTVVVGATRSSIVRPVQLCGRHV